MLEQFPFKILISQGLQVQLPCIKSNRLDCWTASLFALQHISAEPGAAPLCTAVNSSPAYTQTHKDMQNIKQGLCIISAH